MRSPANLPTRRWWILAAVSLTQLLTVIDGTVVNVALPTAQAALGLSDAERQWVVTAYALAFGSFLLLGGRISDLWGRKRTYLVAMALFGLSSALGGLAGSGGVLLVARAAQGLAAAFLAPAALAFVTLTFPGGRERNLAFAIFGSVSGFGAAAGMFLGGMLTQYFSWRWCLLINVPLVVIGIVWGAVLLKESRVDGERGFDLAGTLACTLGFGSLVFGLTLAEYSWTSWSTISCLALAAVLIAGFVVIQRRARHPLLPLRIIQDRTRGAAFALQALMGMAGSGVMLYLAFHLQLVLRLPPSLAGLATVPFTVSVMATVPFATRMLNRFGPRRQLVIGPLVSAAGLVLLTRISVDGPYWTHVLPGVLLMGAGMGLSVVPLQNLSLLGVLSSDAGVASAASSATNQLGGSVGLGLTTLVYLATVGGIAASGPEALVRGYASVFAASAVLMLAASAIAWRLLPAHSSVSVKLDVNRTEPVTTRSNRDAASRGRPDPARAPDTGIR